MCFIVKYSYFEPSKKETTLVVAAIERLLSPGQSVCGRCRRPWAFAKPHITIHKGGDGCFPLCQRCWDRLSPAERLPYYRELLDMWVVYNPDRERDWPLIEAAVL